MVIVADKRLETDGSMHSFAQKINSSVPILLISRPSNYEFNEAVLSLAGKPYVIWDVIEYGWDAKIEYTHFFGFGEQSFHGMAFFPQFKDKKSEWCKLNDFIEANQPIRYFKRELLAKDADDFYVPLNYPCSQEIPEVQSKEDFLNRPFDVFYSWGLSHPERRRLHGEISVAANKEGYIVCDNLYFMNQFVANESNEHKWLISNLPHYCRFPCEQITAINGIARVSISMPGAGTCCFRHTEASINSTMLMKEDNMAWSFPWVHNSNCIKFSDFGDEVKIIQEALSNQALYDIYVNGVENCRKYYLPNYISHIESLINNA